MNTGFQISELFDSFKGLRALVIGDVMIDAYFSGSVDRISPEAPVPIVSVNGEENRLGGAANVALNIKSLGAEVTLCSVIGNDEKARLFEQLCQQQGIQTDGLLSVDGRLTSVKTRIIGNNHQLLRVDSEKIEDLSEDHEQTFIDRIENLLDNEQIDVVIFEDYDKGVITENVIQRIIKKCRNKGIPSTADPKKKNFLSYKGITLFKPNLKELKEGTNIDFEQPLDSQYHVAVSSLQSTLEADIIFVTLSEHGVHIRGKEEEFHIPAHIRKIADVSGAGDTVISVASLCLACEQDLNMIASLSNLAGGLVCEKVGVKPIEKEVLIEEAITSIKSD